MKDIARLIYIRNYSHVSEFEHGTIYHGDMDDDVLKELYDNAAKRNLSLSKAMREREPDIIKTHDHNKWSKTKNKFGQGFS